MPPSTLKPGSYVGRYRVEAFVEQGGMGEVFRAFDPMLDREVALKSIRLDMRRDKAALERFQREAKTLAQLNHPNICQVYDWIEADGATYMAMEWVPGLSLTKKMEAALPLSDILGILETIAEALRAAHLHQIVHRDLKPGNILLRPEGGLKVLDFGLAKTVDEVSPSRSAQATGPTFNLSALDLDSQATQAITADLRKPRAQAQPSDSDSDWEGVTQAGIIVGTLGYLSPEQANREPVGPPSDIFALGILAHELLTGRKPFEGLGLAVIQSVARHERIPLPPLRTARRWPRKLIRLLEGMLRPDPGQRLKAEEVVEALRAFRRPISPAWIAGMAAASALLVAGGLYLLRGRGVIADLTRERPARLAILPMANGTRDPNLEAIIRVAMPDMLGAALQESTKLEIIDPEAVAKACELQKIDPHQPLDPQQASRLARTLGSKLFLVGRISRDAPGRTDTFSYALLDPQARPRHEGNLQQAHQATFQPNAFLIRSAAALLKAVDPLGTGPQASAYQQLSPQALEAFAQGTAQLYKGDFKKAEPHLMQIAYAAPNLARGVALYARCLHRLSKTEALPASHWALLASQRSKDRLTEATALQLIADLARERGDRGVARMQVERAMALAGQSRDRDRESSCWKTLGLLSLDEGKWEEAEASFQKALLLAKATGNQRFEADFLTSLANLALSRGDLTQAELKYREILRAYESMENRFGEAVALNNLGVFLLTAQRVAEAEAPLQKALSLRVAIGDGRGEASTLRNLGILQQMRGAYSEARATQQRALGRSRQIEFALGEAHALYRLADLDRLEGRFSTALQGYKAAASLFEARGGITERADALAGAAECEARSRPPHFAAAEALLQQAHSGSALRTQALRARAWIHFGHGRTAAALHDLETARKDPEHQAPEGVAEMTSTLATFRKTLSK